MDINRILFIINPSAGQHEPVMEYINEIFNKNEFAWLVHELKKGEKASEVIRKKKRIRPTGYQRRVEIRS